MEKEGWNLDSAITWFYEHKDDDEAKEYFEKEIEDDTEEQGRFLILPRLAVKTAFFPM